jgi:hypothetical protein
VPRKVLPMKAAAAALVAVLSIGGVAAAAGGLLPDQASPVADQAPPPRVPTRPPTGSARPPRPTWAGQRRPGGLPVRGGRRRPGRMPPGRPGPGCAGPGRPARVATTARGWTRWRSRRRPRPPAATTTSPPTARTWPPAPAPTPTEPARVAAERFGTADQRLATVQRPPRGPGAACQHRPWRARTRRTPNHHRLTGPTPPTTGRPAEPTAGGNDGRAPRHPPAPRRQSEVDKFAGLADAPVTALGLSSGAADALGAGAWRQERSRPGGQQVCPTGPGNRAPDGRAAITLTCCPRPGIGRDQAAVHPHLRAAGP